MKVLVLGAGAIGCYAGGLLALGGHQVTFAVRAATGDALRRHGIRLEGPRGDWHLAAVDVLTDPIEPAGAFDVGLSCVKLYDAESSARQWAATLGACSAVISLQNGIDGAQRVAAGSGLAKVWGGLAFVAARLDEPGRVRYQSDMSSLTFGGPGAMRSSPLAAFEHAVNEVGRRTPFAATRVDDIASAQWQKFTALATNAALTCLVRRPAGVVYRDADLLSLARQSIGEVAAVGRAAGAHLPPGHEAASLAALQALPVTMYASMHHDLAAGRRLELDGLSGVVVQLGRQHGLATPFHSMAYACLKPHVDGGI